MAGGAALAAAVMVTPGASAATAAMIMVKTPGVRLMMSCFLASHASRGFSFTDPAPSGDSICPDARPSWVVAARCQITIHCLRRRPWGCEELWWSPSTPGPWDYSVIMSIAARVRGAGQLGEGGASRLGVPDREQQVTHG